MIRPEDVADLQPGDVVELRDVTWPEGTAVRGPLYGDGVGYLYLASFFIRYSDGRLPSYDKDWELTVVSRAPRPLYTNSDRTEPVPGDVVSRGDSDGATWSWCPLRSGVYRWRNTGNDEWFATEDFLRFGNGLRLLVDGETGQQVGPDPAAAWDEGFEAAAEWIRETNQSIDPPRNPYKTGQVVQ